jgi:hypothetical protein
MATIIVRRPRRERMEQQVPEEVVMSRDEMPKLGAFDPTFPSELEGLIPPEEWAQIIDRLDEYWIPFFKREQEIESCSMCLCCCCCCTLGLSLFAMCCYSSCAGRKLDKRKINGRRQMKAYFEEELNPKYSAQGVRFAVAPTIKTFYVEIRIDKPGTAGNDNRSRAESTTDEEKEGEPLLRRAKEDSASHNGGASSAQAQSSTPAPVYGTQPADTDVDSAADGLDGLD